MTRQNEEYLNEGLEIGRKERDEVLNAAEMFLKSYESSFGEPEQWKEFHELKRILIQYKRIIK